MKRIFLLLGALTIALAAGTGGWWLGQRDSTAASPASTERKPLFYQSPMHPWIKSDVPGQCTICGMDLAPVFEPENIAGNPSPDIVMLPPGSPQVAGIATAPAMRRPLVRTLRVAGTIDDDQTRHRFLSASARGRIDRLFVNYLGAEVTEGQPLAEFYSRELLAAIAEYQVAAPELKKAVAQRLRQYGLTEAQIAGLAGRDRNRLSVPLLAPISGTVVAQNVYEGQWVNEGEKLLEIADFSKMWFVFDAYERDLPWLRTGQEVEIRTPSHPGQTFKAPITFIDPNLDPATRTAKARVELANPLIEEAGRPRRQFLHRLYAEATVNTTEPKTLTVPRSAIIWPGGHPRVFVDEGNGAYRRVRVELGREGDRDVEVLHGLEPGQQVVVQGGVLLDGQAQLHHGFSNGEESGATATVKQVTAGDCPVSEEKLGSMGEPFVLLHEGREVRLCCKLCKADFDSDPALYLRKLPNPEHESSRRPSRHD